MSETRWVRLAILDATMDRHPSATSQVVEWLRTVANEAGHDLQVRKHGTQTHYGYTTDSPEMPAPGYTAQTRRWTDDPDER